MRREGGKGMSEEGRRGEERGGRGELKAFYFVHTSARYHAMVK